MKNKPYDPTVPASAARGPRPSTFYKVTRAMEAAKRVHHIVIVADMCREHMVKNHAEHQLSKS